MSAEKIIAVTGATGSQGGGVARSILADQDSAFAVHAITREPASPAARELAALGAEVVRADFHDEPTWHKAFEGVCGAFLATNLAENASRIELG